MEYAHICSNNKDYLKHIFTILDVLTYNYNYDTISMYLFISDI